MLRAVSHLRGYSIACYQTFTVPTQSTQLATETHGSRLCRQEVGWLVEWRVLLWLQRLPLGLLEATASVVAAAAGVLVAAARVADVAAAGAYVAVAPVEQLR